MRVISENAEELVARHYPLYVWTWGGVLAALTMYIAVRCVIFAFQTDLSELVDLICPLTIAIPTALFLSWPMVTLTLDRAAAEVRVERKGLFGKRTWTGLLEDLTGTKAERYFSATRKRFLCRLVLEFDQGGPMVLDIADSEDNLEEVQESVDRFIRLIRRQISRL